MLHAVINQSWQQFKKKFKSCNETLACATDETKLWSSPSAKKCQNPCSGPPPVYQDFITHHDWLVKKKLRSICQSGWREIRNAFPVISLSLLKAWNKDIGTASQTLLTGWTGVRLRMRRRLAIKLRIYALTFSYVNFLSGPMSVVLILNTSFFFRSNASSVLHINRNELKQSILHFCQFFSYMHLCTLFCFYKNVVFPAQVEYSYFSAIFRLDFILVLFSN